MLIHTGDVKIKAKPAVFVSHAFLLFCMHLQMLGAGTSGGNYVRG